MARPDDEWPAYDVFVGYLLLDALIANTDRDAWNRASVFQAASGLRYSWHPASIDGFGPQRRGDRQPPALANLPPR